MIVVGLGIITEITQIKDIIEQQTKETVKVNKKKQIYKTIITYDIEASSFIQNDKKYTITYSHAFCINGFVCMVRSDAEAKIIFECIKEYFNEHHLIIWIHNLSYEFQAIHTFFPNITNILTQNAKRNIISFEVENIEFRCTYKITRKSLAEATKNLPVKKLKDDLDYNLLRTPITPLTDKELGYIKNDVLSLYVLVQDLIKLYGGIRNIPRTATGATRNHFKKELCNDKEYMTQVSKLRLSLEQYMIMRRAFRGGYTQANSLFVDETLENIGHADINSSYPYQMVTMKFPMSNMKKLSLSVDDFLTFGIDTLDNTRGWIADVTLNITLKEGVFAPYISTAKCLDDSYFECIDKGKVRSGSVTVPITNVDWEIIEKVYDYEVLDVREYYYFKLDYLPLHIVMETLNLYAKKTTLKGIESKILDYNRSKETINSIYGMMATDPIKDDFVYDNEKQEVIKESLFINEMMEKLKKENDKKYRFLFYPWGVFITAYARRMIFDYILALGIDWVYTDTDCVKFFINEKTIETIDRLNEKYYNITKESASDRNIDFDLFMPKKPSGEPCLLGKLDLEEPHDKFKVLGPKRYLSETDGKIEMTVAGLPKSAVFNFAFDKFTMNADVEPKYSKVFERIGYVHIKDYLTHSTNIFIGDVSFNSKDDYRLFLSETDGKIEMTVAGLPKSAVVNSAFDKFSMNAVVNPERSGKKGHVYRDLEHIEYVHVKDYLGIECDLMTSTGTFIENVGFDFKEKEEYQLLLLNLKGEI
jgi:hypothetical protein